MVKGIKFLLILIGLSACMKLEERMVLLDQHCLSCKSLLEDSLQNMPGIYWAEYSPEKAAVKIKFAPKEFDPEPFHQFLGGKGFLNMGDSTKSPPPTRVLQIIANKVACFKGSALRIIIFAIILKHIKKLHEIQESIYRPAVSGFRV